MNELFLLARIAGRGVAVPTEQVVSVVDIGEVVAVPRAHASVLGLAALRSRVVTVIDTALALGLDSKGDAGTRAVIIKVDGHDYALLMDALEDVVPCERHPLEIGYALDGGWTAAGAGLVERDGEPLLVLDVAALIPTMATAA